MAPSLLVPPTPPRHRASSTNLRPALTLHTLGTRPKSSAMLEPLPCTPPASVLTADASKSSSAALSSAALSALVDRCLSYVHDAPIPPPLLPPTPTYSARSSTDDLSFAPLSATTTAVEDEPVFEEKRLAYSVSRPLPWLRSSPSIHAPLLFVMIFFTVSTALVVLSAWSLPFTFTWPQNITDLAQLGRELSGYANSGLVEFSHVFGVMAVTTVWMHAWSVPGSVLWNVLAGALFPPVLATVVFAILTTLGSICASLLSAPIAPFITHFFPRALGVARSAFEGDSSNSPVWIRIAVLRLVGVVPWSGINIACGVIDIPLRDCFLGTFIGSIPWTAVTCQIGDILHTVVATPSPNPESISSILMSPSLIIKLIVLSILSLAPILGRNYLRTWLSSSPQSLESDDEEHIPRWAWVREWRSKVRIASPSRTRTSSEVDVDSLREGKEGDLP